VANNASITLRYFDARGRATFRRLLEARPVPITARPGEADALEVIHAIL
jgi:hypothetical protein